jgi:hypothetical protein
VNFLPQPGERALIVGQTGGGKTVFALWLLVRLPATPAILYDTKIEPKFDQLPNSTVVQTIPEMREAAEDPRFDYVIVRPPVEMLGEPQKLDEYLWQQYLHLHGTICYIDEGGSFHARSGGAYKGLISLMMRGRSKGITTILSTQRPIRIDRTILSEMTKAYVFRIQDKRDREAIDNVIPEFSKLPIPKKHWLYFWEQDLERAILFEPVKLDAAFLTGYTDEVASGETSPNKLDQTDQADDAPAPSKHIWV